MWLLLLEAALALALLIFIVAWTIWPKRKELLRTDADTPAPAEDPRRDRTGPGDRD